MKTNLVSLGGLPKIIFLSKICLNNLMRLPLKYNLFLKLLENYIFLKSGD